MTANPTPDTQEKLHMLDQLVDIVDRAGQAIMGVYQSPDFGIRAKADASPVTAADLAANAIIVEGLARNWPAIPILTEEEKNHFQPEEKPPLYWAVDPLDGTKEFIKRNGEFTVNIALIEEGRPVLGIVTAPALGLAYRGAIGLGAQERRDNAWHSISTAKDRPAGVAVRVACSRSHPSPETAAFLQRFEKVEAREIGSSLKFCLIAAGEVDVYPRFGPTCIWDTAAGQAVLEAAGGVVYAANGQPLRYSTPGVPLNPDFVAWASQPH